MATALIVAMTIGMTAGSAWADESESMVRRWVCDGDSWYYYNGKGVMVKDKEQYIKDTWYGFDEEGRMYSNILFDSHDGRMNDVVDEEDGVEIMPDKLYAFAAGNLASNTWVKLNEAGEMYTAGDGDAYWYYFEGGQDKEHRPSMVRGREEKIQGNKYRFGVNGEMYQSKWYYTRVANTDNEGTTEGDYAVNYYQSDGPKAVKKWLPIDGYWYRFDSEGNVPEVAYMASPSDASEDPVVAPWQYHKISEQAPARQVHSISLASGSNADIKIALGESVKLKFQVTLASDSNARIQNFDDFDNFHDFEPGTHMTGRFHVSKAETNKNGICTVEYKPKKLGEEDVELKIDQIVSRAGITVTTVAPESISQKKDAVETLLTDALEDGAPTEEARNTILEILQTSDGSDKKAIQKTIAQNSNYAALDSTYAMENAIEVKPVKVEEEAQKLLSGGTISLVGGALNADAGSAVELNVAPSAEVPVLKEEFKNKVSFDIKLAINDEENPELDFPIKITMPVPTGFNANSMSLFHIHNGEEDKVDFTHKDGMITFTVTGFSDFVFAQNDTEEENNGHHGGGSGGGGGSSSGSSSSGVVTTDSRKGRVNSLTGIIIGSGDGYSKWIQETIPGQATLGRWKLQYADGTFAVGGYVLDELGNPKRDDAGNLIEQPLWEMISGAWYAFGADGYAKSGMVFDPAQNGWFYIDINTGMKTGWQQIDGQWYYFNMTSDGSRGIMYVSRKTPDGYEVGADGVWNGQ